MRRSPSRSAGPGRRRRRFARHSGNGLRQLPLGYAEDSRRPVSADLGQDLREAYRARLPSLIAFGITGSPPFRVISNHKEFNIGGGAGCQSSFLRLRSRGRPLRHRTGSRGAVKPHGIALGDRLDGAQHHR